MVIINPYDFSPIWKPVEGDSLYDEIMFLIHTICL